MGAGAATTLVDIPSQPAKARPAIKLGRRIIGSDTNDSRGEDSIAVMTGSAGS